MAYSEMYRFGSILSGMRGAVVEEGVVQGDDILGAGLIVKGLRMGNDLDTTLLELLTWSTRSCRERNNLGGEEMASMVKRLAAGPRQVRTGSSVTDGELRVRQNFHPVIWIYSGDRSSVMTGQMGFNTLRHFGRVGGSAKETGDAGGFHVCWRQARAEAYCHRAGERGDEQTGTLKQWDRWTGTDW